MVGVRSESEKEEEVEGLEGIGISNNVNMVAEPVRFTGDDATEGLKMEDSTSTGLSNSGCSSKQLFKSDPVCSQMDGDGLLCSTGMPQEEDVNEGDITAGLWQKLRRDLDEVKDYLDGAKGKEFGGLVNVKEETMLMDSAHTWYI